MYGDKYCPFNPTAPTNPQLGTAVQANLIPPACKAPTTANTCSSAYNNVNGECCPLQGFECSVLYANDQFCTNGALDINKISYKCPQFDKFCFGTQFRKVTGANNEFKACCPASATPVPVKNNVCVPAFGFEATKKGGFFCDLAGEIRPDVVATCTTTTAPPAAANTDCTPTALETTVGTTPAIKCCPKSGYECIGTNDKYCTNGIPDAAKIDVACPTNPNTMKTAAGGNNPAANKYYVKVETTPATYIECPHIGKECDPTTSAYDATTHKNAYCDRIAD